MSEPQYGEPWKYDGHVHEMETVDGKTLFACEHGGAPRPEVVARIVACVNFCREFPTEALLNRRLIYAKDMDHYRSLADMPGLDGFVVVAKEHPTERASSTHNL